MKIEQCLYVLEAARTGSIRKAAGKLFISQQGLSQAIRSVENELGIRIFSRCDQGLILTAAGQAAVNHFQEMVDNYQNLLTEIGQQNGVADCITIYYSSSLGSLYAPSIVTRLIKRYPNLCIRVLPYEITQFHKHSLDENSILIFSGPKEKMRTEYLGDSSLRYCRCVTVPILCAVSETSPYAGRKLITRNHLQSASWAIISHERGLLSDVLGNWEESSVAFEGSDCDLCRDIVSNTNAIGFTNVITEHYHRKTGLVQIPFEGSILLDYGCIVSSGQLPSVVEECLNMVQEELSLFSEYDLG